jgi:hypothetical protein
MLLLSLALLVGAFALYVYVPTLLIYWSYPWPVYAMLAAAVGGAIASSRRGWLRMVTIGLSGLVTAVFVLFTVVLSHLSHGQLAVHPGDPFPDFTLQTSGKESFSPSQLKGQSAALYVFYRGDW